MDVVYCNCILWTQTDNFYSWNALFIANMCNSSQATWACKNKCVILAKYFATTIVRDYPSLHKLM